VIRVVILGILALVVYFLLRSAVAAFISGLRADRGAARARGVLRDDLVRDPVCETYVPRRAAVTHRRGAETYYFCSPGCAEKFQAGQ
jgi:YHS domain-containing protein